MLTWLCYLQSFTKDDNLNSCQLLETQLITSLLNFLLHCLSVCAMAYHSAAQDYVEHDTFRKHSGEHLRFSCVEPYDLV